MGVVGWMAGKGLVVGEGWVDGKNGKNRWLDACEKLKE